MLAKPEWISEVASSEVEGAGRLRVFRREPTDWQLLGSALVPPLDEALGYLAIYPHGKPAIVETVVLLDAGQSPVELPGWVPFPT